MGVPPASLRASATCVARAAGPESRGRHAQDRPGPSAAAKLAQVCLAAALATARRSRSLARRTAAARHVQCGARDPRCTCFAGGDAAAGRSLSRWCELLVRDQPMPHIKQ